MPIAKNLSHVPADAGPSRHQPPASDPVFAPMLAESWAAEYIDANERETAVPCRIRHSKAGTCSRALSYGLLGIEVSEPLSIADHYRFNMGTMVHDLFQDVLLSLPDGAEVETIGSFGEPNEYGRVLSAGHGDATVTTDNGRYHIELKTINGYGFQRSVGLKGDAQGPRHSAKLQGALNALAADADTLVIVYLSLDVIGAKPAANAGLAPWQRFSAEWRYDRAEFEPWALGEIERFNEVVLLADQGLVAERFIPDTEIPDDARITNPAKGTWTVEHEGRVFNAGETWHCGYCPFRAKCTEDAKAGL